MMGGGGGAGWFEVGEDHWCVSRWTWVWLRISGNFQNDLVSKYVFKNGINLIKFDQVMRHDNPKRIYLI